MSVQCIQFVDYRVFWEMMRHPRFIRTTHQSGRIGGITYIVDIPPEDVRGFIDSKVEEIMSWFVWAGKK
jgi:hypothetical protein